VAQWVADNLAGVAFVGGDGEAAGNGVLDAFAGHGGSGEARGASQAAQLLVNFVGDRGADPCGAFAGTAAGGFRAFHGVRVARVKILARFFLPVLQDPARLSRMPTKVLALHVPADVLEKIDDLSRRQCLSRSAAVRLILINEIQRRRLEADDAQPEAAA
jgi:hypothetical protein